MKEALGMVEVHRYVVAIEVADVMIKTANVRLDELRFTRGLGRVTITVLGNVGAINAAISAGEQVARMRNGYISSKVIPRPIENIFGETNDTDKTGPIILEKNEHTKKEAEVKEMTVELDSEKNEINTDSTIEDTPKESEEVVKEPNKKTKSKPKDTKKGRKNKQKKISEEEN